ncbi:MAG: hypothetical protein IJY26_04120 [Clostridia bacterium]|nr:hypothetical protein [Clostridia bacterium]
MKKTISCALPGQMTLEEIELQTLQPKRSGSQQKALLKVNEKNCRRAVAEKFSVSPGCVAVVDWCWCKVDKLLCVRAYVQRVEHLVQYKGGFADPTPKVWKVLD